MAEGRIPCAVAVMTKKRMRNKTQKSMKYSYNTFRLYRSEKQFSYVIRARLIMKDPVDCRVLEAAVNKTMTRYPYFAVSVRLEQDGAYVLEHNPAAVAVLEKGTWRPKLGSKEVNRHLLFAECTGRESDIYISHALCGGKGFQPFVMSCIWQYVADRYSVLPEAPSIRKPGTALLPDETAEPTLEMLNSAGEPIFRRQSKKPAILGWDYLNGLYNPFRRKPNFRLYTFSQKEILKFAKGNDASVVSFFLVVAAKALDRVLPEKERVIGGETAHNPSASLGIPNTHCDLLSHVLIDYEREMLRSWSMEKLGTMTRGQILLQTDPSVSFAELGRGFETLEALEGITGLEAKMEYVKQHNPNSGKDAEHGTFILNYTGRADWGEVADYMESYALIVEGHMLFEVSSMGDKIFLTQMQLIDEEKYAAALQQVLTDLGISFTVEGPFPRQLTKHELPEA